MQYARVHDQPPLVCMYVCTYNYTSAKISVLSIMGLKLVACAEPCAALLTLPIRVFHISEFI